MKPLYAHCPHCGFPAVVRTVERGHSRYCRQCRSKYKPGEASGASPQGTPSHSAALRTRLRRRKGSLATSGDTP